MDFVPDFVSIFVIRIISEYIYNIDDKMVECYCPKCGKKGSLTRDKRENNGEVKKFWKVGHGGTEDRTYCYIGREETTVKIIGEEGIYEKTVGGEDP